MNINWEVLSIYLLVGDQIIIIPFKDHEFEKITLPRPTRIIRSIQKTLLYLFLQKVTIIIYFRSFPPRTKRFRTIDPGRCIIKS